MSFFSARAGSPQFARCSYSHSHPECCFAAGSMCGSHTLRAPHVGVGRRISPHSTTRRETIHGTNKLLVCMQQSIFALTLPGDGSQYGYAQTHRRRAAIAQHNMRWPTIIYFDHAARLLYLVDVYPCDCIVLIRLPGNGNGNELHAATTLAPIPFVPRLEGGSKLLQFIQSPGKSWSSAEAFLLW